MQPLQATLHATPPLCAAAARRSLAQACMRITASRKTRSGATSPRPTGGPARWETRLGSGAAGAMTPPGCAAELRRWAKPCLLAPPLSRAAQSASPGRQLLPPVPWPRSPTDRLWRRYVDIRRSEVREVQRKRLQWMAAQGCDGVDPGEGVRCRLAGGRHEPRPPLHSHTVSWGTHAAAAALPRRPPSLRRAAQTTLTCTGRPPALSSQRPTWRDTCGGWPTRRTRWAWPSA